MQGKKLYVGNLNYSTTETELRELFSAHGKVTDVRIIGDKGFGFIEMDTQAEAEQARDALDGHEFNGRALKVSEARKNPAGPGGNRKGPGGGRPGGGRPGGGGGYSGGFGSGYGKKR